MADLHTIWWKIYPNDDRHRWMPLIWLPFMVWFFVDPAVEACRAVAMGWQHSVRHLLHLALSAMRFPAPSHASFLPSLR